MVFFHRRSGTGSLSTASDLLRDVDTLQCFFIIAPLFTFKESHWNYNQIINEGHFNSYFDYPMIFAELFTILPRTNRPWKNH